MRDYTNISEVVMKKAGALTILISMLTGLLAWGGVNIITNGKDIVKLIERDKSNKELLIEMRKDVKTLLIRSE